MSDQELVCAIDVGTSGTRTAVFHAVTGKLLAQTHQEYSSIFPHTAWVEQRASDWWNSACKTTRNIMKKLGSQKSDLVAVSVTNQRETIVPVDQNGSPLHNAIVWQDRRAIPQCESIREQFGDDKIYKETGLTIDSYFSAPKILWFKQENPTLFESTHKFLLVHDFMIHQLSGEFATDYSNASRTMLFSLKRFEWSKQLTEPLEIPLELLPAAYPSGTEVGQVTKKASKKTGLPLGLPVVVGGGDQQCGAIGVGVVEPGRIKATIGTGTFILAYETEPRLDPQRRLLCSCHAVPGKWVVEASIFTSGIVYRWFRDQFCFEERQLAELVGSDAYELLNIQAAQSPAGARGLLLLPYFVGAGAPYWNPTARGAILGLALGHRRVDLIRAIMEGTSFEVRRNINVMRELGIPIEEIRVTGGATRSPLWNQILADICALTVKRSQLEEATALGAAILASVGGGVYKNVQAATKAMIAIGDQFQPSTQHKALYETLFEIQSRAYQALEKAKVFSRLATLDQ